jgi:hypothetical protein
MRMAMSHSVVLLLVGAVVVAGAYPTMSNAEITQIVINADAHVVNGDETHIGYCQNFNVTGTNIASVSVSWPGHSPLAFTTDGDGAWHCDSPDYNSLVDLQTAYPTGINYQIAISQLVGSPIVESLLFDASQPNGFVPVKSPSQNQVIDSNSAPEFTWNTVSSGDGDALGCQLEVYNGKPFVQTIPYDLKNTSWTPPGVSSLQPGAQYTFCLDLYRLGSAPQNLPISGQADCTYYEIFAHTNEIDFCTTVPEPSVLVLMLSGFATLFLCRRAKPKAA